jgi:hypothetical protein
MRVIAEHQCHRHHRNAAAFARCAWPEATEVLGSGFLAVVTGCPHPRVFLLERLRPAHTLRSELAVFGCGAGCTGDHELVAIDIDGPAVAA